jgi:ribosomal-protein-alanine N-acetyltransferase
MNKNILAQTELRPIDWCRDQASLLGIEQRSFAHPWTAEQFDAFRLRPESGGLVAQWRGRIIGYVLFEHRAADLYIAHGAVDRAFQRSGVGRVNFRAVRDLAENAQPVSLCVRPSNIGAQRLYAELGFVCTETLPSHYGDGEDALVMQYDPFAHAFTQHHKLAHETVTA